MKAWQYYLDEVDQITANRARRGIPTPPLKPEERDRRALLMCVREVIGGWNPRLTFDEKDNIASHIARWRADNNVPREEMCTLIQGAAAGFPDMKCLVFLPPPYSGTTVVCFRLAPPPPRAVQVQPVQSGGWPVASGPPPQQVVHQSGVYQRVPATVGMARAHAVWLDGLAALNGGPSCECGGKSTGAADYSVGHSGWCPVNPRNKGA